jgi:hypothetical protein
MDSASRHAQINTSIGVNGTKPFMNADHLNRPSRGA